ncbi:MAG: hypothetical protein DRN99_01620 [Thermoproteota archaeon]|nr:MAG: hypothetical protein DRN99_01620 [Candidatus Korarchaeota archaeon]
MWRRSAVISYPLAEDGYTPDGEKIPDIPVVYIAIRVGRLVARGPAVVDTGFDGGIYPNMPVIRLFQGRRPIRVVELENPLAGRSEFEVYLAPCYLYHHARYYEIGEVRVYIPTDPELVSDEVLVGREVLNRLKLILISPGDGRLSIEI